MICRGCGHPKSEHTVNLHGGWSCQHEREVMGTCQCTTVQAEAPAPFPSYFHNPAQDARARMVMAGVPWW